MEYANLGSTGLKVSRICLGCMSYGSSKWRDWVLDYDASKPFIQRALELGINFFDTADMYYEDSDFEVVKRVTEVAKKRGVPNAQVAIAWLLQQPGVTAPIVGATRMQHLEDAVAALSVKLTEEELKSLAEPYKPHPVLGNLS